MGDVYSDWKTKITDNNEKSSCVCYRTLTVVLFIFYIQKSTSMTYFFSKRPLGFFLIKPFKMLYYDWEFLCFENIINK